MLRKSIEAIIREHEDPEKAAIEVAKYLDRTVGLYGNGWLDNDELMLRELGMMAEDGSVPESHG